MTAARFSSALLERDQETELLHRAWRQARAGHGSAWFLCAEAGGGKTRLAAEFTRASGGRTLWGAAEPVSPPDPYLAVIDAIPGFAPASSRAGSVAAAVTLLDQATRASPVIVVLDDLHFADEGTIAVTVRLSRECADRPWLVLAAFRPGEGPPGHLAPLAEVAAQSMATRLDLAPLSRVAVETLIAGVRGRPAGAEEAEAIFADSGGNPWFAEALARGNGAVSAARDRISLKLDRLEQTAVGALRLLEAMAPATRPLPYELVAELCGGDSRELRRTLTVVREAGVLREDGGAWRFRHELLRRSLLDGMIAADRRDAHRALAETLERGTSASSPPPALHAPSPPSLHGSAAELAMHYAAAGDLRAAGWAVQAAREARAVDAHREAMAQLERALAFDLDADGRRSLLQEAAGEAYALGRFADNRRLAEEGLAIPGGEPEAVARLHQLAARAAYYEGDIVADETHLAAAEQALAGRPVSLQVANIAVARAARAAAAVEPERLAAAAERALAIVEQLGESTPAARVAIDVRRFLAVSRIGGGDPSGFALIEELVREAEERRLPADTAVSALGGAHEQAVISLFHREAAGLRERLFEKIRRHELGLMALAEPSHILELVQRGAYEDARARAAQITAPAVGTFEHAKLTCAGVLREARAGSLDRARTALAAARPATVFQQTALIDLARLELAIADADAGLGDLARRVYETMLPRRYARIAGTAAVGLARAGVQAPPTPEWLVVGAPLRVLWDWADGITRADALLLRDVSERLAAMDCPYEAALARRDAGDLGEAYRMFQALGAVTAARQTAERLRAAAQRIPRRTRSSVERGGLTPTEHAIARLVAAGSSNEQAAETLGISARTVETHLTKIYQKTGQRGRSALIAWWSRRSPEPPATDPMVVVRERLAAWRDQQRQD
jgi:DNA-binding CsgD family transcriptional regulator